MLQTAARYLNRKPEDFKSSTHFPETDHVMASAHINAPQIRRLKGRYGFGAERIVELVDRKPELADKVLTSDTIFAELVYACETQLVVHLDDLMLRRTRLGLVLPKGGEAVLTRVKAHCLEALGWDEPRWDQEASRYQRIISAHYSLPVEEAKKEERVV
ncbi:hypothetical protein A3741_28030 [Oleiphilus sp. HI0069]|nr:hypothetical protein A3741_28030 [Oleiphilus sp. HI0069]